MNSFPSWQWPTDALSELKLERFSCPLNGRPIEWEALLLPLSHGGMISILLRVAGSDQLFCIAAHDGTPDFLPSRRVSGTKVRDACIKALAHKKIARLYFLNEAGNLRAHNERAHTAVTVGARGRGRWKDWAETTLEPHPNGASFRLFPEIPLDEWMQRSALDIWHKLEPALSDPLSDATFARQWLHKTDEQKEDMVWNWPRAERQQRKAEFQELLRIALWKQDSLWQQSDSWHLCVSSTASTHLYIHHPDDDHTVPDELQDAVARLWRHFAPLNHHLKHECVFHQDLHSADLFHIEAHRPTHHERLEATLRWYEWENETR